MESWKRILPEWEVFLWNDLNGPLNKPFFRDNLKKRPVKSSNYCRMWALQKFGGVYLDADVELLRPFDLEHGAFLGMQTDTPQDCINGAVIGAIAGHPLLQMCMDRMDAADESANEAWSCPVVITEELTKLGLRGVQEQKVGDVVVYDRAVFYPFRWDQVPDRKYIKPETRAIHWWNGSWATRHPAARDNFPE